MFEIDKETEDKKEKRVKKQLDDVRNQLERVSFFEENIMPVQRQPIGLSESERAEQTSGFETKYLLKATTAAELRELTGQNEKAFNAHYKAMMFNNHLKKKRDEILNERRKKRITIIDVKCSHSGEIVCCDSGNITREYLQLDLLLLTGFMRLVLTRVRTLTTTSITIRWSHPPTKIVRIASEQLLNLR